MSPKVMRRIAAAVSAIVFSCCLHASPLSFSIEAGLSHDTVSSSDLVIGASGSYDDFSLRLQHQVGGDVNLAFAWMPEQGRSIRHVLSAYTEYFPGEGGWSSLSYLFTQHFRFGVFGLGYGAGVQAAVSYSPFSRCVLWSLSPELALGMGLFWERFSISVYAALNHPYEMSWRFRPSAGIRLEASPGGGSSLFLDGSIGFAEALMDPVYVIQDWSVRAGYIYRGNV